MFQENYLLLKILHFWTAKPFSKPLQKVCFIIPGVERQRGQEVGAAALELLRCVLVMFEALWHGLSSLYYTLSSANKKFSSHTDPDEPCLPKTLALCRVSMPLEFFVACGTNGCFNRNV